MRVHRRTLLAGVAASLTLSRPAKAADSMRVAVISDLNGSYGSTDYGLEVTAAVAQIVRTAPDLVICTGDMIAGQRSSPKLTEAELTAMWDAFHATVTTPLKQAGIPLLVTPGNHDASAYPGYERERQAYDRSWTSNAPEVEILDGERFPFRYAVSHAGVLFIGLDITTTGPQPVEEMEWTAQILREEAPRHRATVVFGHLPVFPVTIGRENDVIGDMGFLDMLEQGGAHLYLSGHHHAYFPFRSHGVLQIAQACLGDGPRPYIGTDRRAEKAMGMLEIDGSGRITESALVAPDFLMPIDMQSLPDSIETSLGRLLRADLSS